MNLDVIKRLFIQLGINWFENNEILVVVVQLRDVDVGHKVRFDFFKENLNVLFSVQDADAKFLDLGDGVQWRGDALPKFVHETDQFEDLEANERT